MVQFFSCLKFDGCCVCASHVQFASCGDKELCLRTVGFRGFTWCVGFVQATRVVHSEVILWFSLTTLHSSDQSMPPTKQIQRMAATCILFDSETWSALWHYIMQNVTLALRDATVQTEDVTTFKSNCMLDIVIRHRHCWLHGLVNRVRCGGAEPQDCLRV